MSGWRHALSWFPGHVARATREMAERLSHVDLVLEVRDARAPRSTASTQISSIVRRAGRADQRMIVVNKADLVSEKQRDQISEWLERDEPGVPIYFTNAKERGSHSKSVRTLLQASVDKMRERAPRLFSPALHSAAGVQSRAAQAISAQAAAATGYGVSATAEVQSLPLIMMVCGVPNVGKSSLINMARRIAADDAASAGRWASHHGSSTSDRGYGGGGTGIRSFQPLLRRKRSRSPAATGKLPGVTTTLSGFQVSWQPSLWCLDTPGVLAPRVDGGWEAALRLGALDLLKYEHSATEGLGAYLLYHFAKCDPDKLKPWPRAAERAEIGANALIGTDDPWRTEILGSGPDPLAAGGGGGDAADHSGACINERFALSLLEAVAIDLNFIRSSDKSGDTNRAAEFILSRMREGKLGDVCFDAHPPELFLAHRAEQESRNPSRQRLQHEKGSTLAQLQRRRERRAARMGRQAVPIV